MLPVPLCGEIKIIIIKKCGLWLGRVGTGLKACCRRSTGSIVSLSTVNTTTPSCVGSSNPMMYYVNWTSNTLTFMSTLSFSVRSSSFCVPAAILYSAGGSKFTELFLKVGRIFDSFGPIQTFFGRTVAYLGAALGEKNLY